MTHRAFPLSASTRILALCRATSLLSVLVFGICGCQARQDLAPKAERIATTASSPPLPQFERASKPQPPANDYVGSQKCSECHSEIAARYAGHPMSHSAAIWGSCEVIEQFDNRWIVAPKGFQYRAELTPDGMRHEERLVSDTPTNEPLYEQSWPMTVVIGSGRRGRSYLMPRDGFLIQSPITWYSSRQTWDLSPGYGERNSHFERRATDGCLQCHVGRMASEPGQADRFQAPPFLEAGIGCERCHGPGERHVVKQRALTASTAGAQSESAAESVDDTIVHPGRLPQLERNSICNQCHLQGPERVLRYGHTEYDFRPGHDLSTVWAIYSKSSDQTESGVPRAVSHVPQVQSSRCYSQSDGRLGCVSCHDPHGVPDAASKVEHYRTRCLNCHGPGHVTCAVSEDVRTQSVADDSCIHCHMPLQATNDVPHTPQSDHRIPRRPQIARSGTETGAGTLSLLPEMTDRIPQAEQRRAQGLLMSRFATDLKDPWLANSALETIAPLLTVFPQDPPLLNAMAAAYQAVGRPEEAAVFWEQVLNQAPDDQTGLKNLAINRHDSGREDRAAELFARYLERYGEDRTIMGRYVHVLGRLQRLEEARALADRAAARYPADYQIRLWLADACAAAGDAAGAERHRRIARRLKPQD